MDNPLVFTFSSSAVAKATALSDVVAMTITLKAMIYMLTRICQNCGRVIPQGTRCPCRNDYNQTRKKQQTDFYWSARWHKLAEACRARALYRDEYLAYYEHRAVPGRIAHHIYPADERPELKASLDNLIFLSDSMHRRVHLAYRAGGKEKENMIKRLLRVRRGASKG